MVRMRPLLVGVATHLPVFASLTRAKQTGGSVSARYCYSVWLRHLVKAYENGIDVIFGTVAELGPGDSLGVGLSALLSGVKRYCSLDVIRFAAPETNLRILDQLIELFRNRASIPDNHELPAVKPELQSYEFPRHILTQAMLARSLAPSRLERIREALNDRDRLGESPIAYFAPWYDAGTIAAGSIEFMFSQAVLEYAHDLEATYAAMDRWLAPRGSMSHEITFRCSMTKQWSGHWACSDRLWAIANGRRRIQLNRAAHSTHLQIIRSLGYEILCDERSEVPPAISRRQLASRFQHLTDEDLRTSSAFIQARKPQR